ncbi:MAG: alpha/beta fold hydrolase [Chlamydiales bacterium]|nr:alpha/beta fold hydrolase [Chlamydiales bacterium]
MQTLNFRPHFGLSSGHLQTILVSYVAPPEAPPSSNWHVALDDSDALSCQVSTPFHFTKIVVLVHGLGGCHTSNYMVRLARKFYDNNVKVVRVNLRGCGSGIGLSSRPYHGGRSDDLLAVLKALKSLHPHTDIHLIGFSLGANIALKLAGELGSDASKLLQQTIAVCPPVDLGLTVSRMQKFRNSIYHAYFLKKVCHQAKPWLRTPVRSIYEFDDQITARNWGFTGAEDYYKRSSSRYFLSRIKHPCKVLFAEDDPFIAKELIELAHNMPLELFTTKHGGHMGFLGKTKEHSTHWLDQQLFSWLNLS